MTDLTLNNCPIKRKFDNNESLGEVIDHLFDQEMERETVLINLEVDNQTIPFEDGLDISKENVNKFDKINFQTQTSVELAFDAVDSCNDYIDILTDKVKEMVTFYQGNETEKANFEFGEMIDILDLYVQLFSKIHSTLKRKYGGKLDVSEDIQKLDIHLLSVLKALIPAREKNDIIMLCDLLEYELIDNLTQWKIKIIPSIKKLKV